VSEIIIKAADADNDVEVKGIVDLFKTAFGQSFPKKAVYRPDFWRRHISSRFTSLIAVQAHQIVAHLALQTDKLCSDMVEVLLPAFDPVVRDQVGELYRDSWKIVTKQAQRSGWAVAYFREYQEFPDLQRLTRESVKAVPVAILPRHQIPGSNHHHINRRKTGALDLLTARVLNRSATLSSKTSSLFVPSSHVQICSQIYGSLGMVRTFLTEEAPSSIPNFGLPTDVRAVDKQPTHLGLGGVFVQPSLVTDSARFNSAIAAAARYQAPLMINMQDPACPAFCEKLENHGYSFCGVMPSIYGRESIVFGCLGDHEVNTKLFYGDGAQALTAYVDSCRSEAGLSFKNGTPLHTPPTF